MGVIGPVVSHRDQKQGKSEMTRGRLIEATCDEISEAGSFSAERVSARAGVSVATFYAHLPTKEAALAAAFSNAMDEMLSMVRRELRIERLLEAELSILAGSFVRAALEFFSARSLIFRHALARLPESPALRRVYRSHESECLACYGHFIELGQSAGKIRPGEAEVLARALLVLSQGLNNPRTLGMVGDDPLIEELVGIVVSLLAPREI
jgi:AcrR family transcriptional regulator